MIQIEDDLGQIHTVGAVGNTCTCGQRSCLHRQRANSFLRKNKFFLFEAYSGFHKELRLGACSRALMWGQVLQQMSGEATVLHYIEKITFEETRDIGLWFSLRMATLSLTQAVEAFCSAVKKWEIPNYAVEHLRNWSAGLLSFHQGNVSFSERDLDVLAQCGDLSSAYSYMFWMRENKRQRQAFWGTALTWTNKLRDPLFMKFLAAKPKRSYEAMVFLDLVAGLHRTNTDSPRVSDEPDNCETLTIPAFRSFYLDNHLFNGATTLKSKWSEYAINPLAVYKRMDLRASGLVTSSLWRAHAFRQHRLGSSSDLTKIPWPEVAIPLDDWCACIELEKYYYPRLTRSQGK